MSAEIDDASAREPVLGEADYERIQALVADRFGIGFPHGRRALLAARMSERIATRRLSSIDDYLDLLGGEPTAHEEWRRLAEIVTNNETYFFREPGHFDELGKLAPSLAARSSKPLSVLSAGCSSGEEAFSLVMLLASHGARLPRGFDVQGIDISSSRLSRARLGRFPLRSFRSPTTPAGLRVEDHFGREGDEWVASEAVNERVRFRLANLVEPTSLAAASFDVIFCRNVLIYAPRDQVSRFLRTLVHALRPGGYLFIGRSESLMGSPSPFRPVRLGEQFAYVLDDGNPGTRSR